MLFLEYGELDVLDGAFVLIDNTGIRTHIPVESIACLLLQPGTRMSHAAVILAARVGCLLIWVGEGGVRLYAAGQPGGARADRLLYQAKLALDDDARLKVVRKMYAVRFGEEPSARPPYCAGQELSAGFPRKGTMAKVNKRFDFKSFAESIAALHHGLRMAAVGSVNRMLTIRNWLIGCYIMEFEQKGEDRAKYGTALLQRLSEQLAVLGVRGVSVSGLRSYRQFYVMYPQLGEVVAAEVQAISAQQIQQGPPAELARDAFSLLNRWPLQIQQATPAEFQPLENQRVSALSPSPAKLLQYFSFTHFVELMRMDEPLQRAFYEIEGIKGNWSVAQLKRQIESLLFERTGMSKDKAGLVDAVHAEKRVMTIEDAIRDPYVLEFTGFPESHQFSELDLETRLLDHIQSFLLELGNGFCFEARQKRITLDNEHDRIDLVFYHRILRCHVLIDLKVRKFQHGDAGQACPERCRGMNFYLNYYRANMMAEGDSPPVGLILCTSRDETRVKYATAGMDNRLFVSKYMTALPSEEKIMAFLRDDRDRTEYMLAEARAKYGESV